MQKQMTLTEIQQNLLTILVDFNNYCEIHDLKYVLAGGTTLGAIRHNGFIPWDDDIDVFMPRPDYNRFHELVIENPMSSNYVIYGIEEGNTAYPFTKIEDKRTIILNSKSMLHNSLWIDIFPLDGIKNETDNEIKNLYKRVHRCSFLLEQASIKKVESSNIVKKIVKHIVVRYAKLKSPESYGKKMIEYITRNNYKECDRIGNICWGYGITEIFPKTVFFPAKKMKFEGIEFWVPNDCDAYLSQIYGDYMKLPPESKRVDHHIEAAIIK